MENISRIRKKIKSIKSSEKITNAMKMVAGTRLSRVQDCIKKSDNFSEQIKKDLSFLTFFNKNNVNVDNLLLASEEKTFNKSLLLILVTSDRGLCGAFNSNILKKFFLFYNESLMNYSKISINTIGNKGFEFLSRRRIPIEYNHIDILKNFEYKSFLEICNTIYDKYLKKLFDFCYIVYCGSNGMSIQQPDVKKLLPSIVSPVHSSNQTLDCYIQPPKDVFIKSLLQKYFTAELLQVLLLSASAEYISRLAAMEYATKNAREINLSLMRRYNKVRQALITKELMEIISGAEVLS